MRILFMSLSDYQTISSRGLYSDMVRQFLEHGDEIYILSPVERKAGKKEGIIKEGKCTILKPVIGNMQKTNIFEKSISMLMLDSILIKSIKKYISNVRFDLILYPTPPITFLNVVKYVKKRDNAETYLLLKDIFPQNSVDIGMMSKKGIKGLLYRYFRNKEKELYRISDHIGCMSKANVKYILEHNPEVETRKVHMCPNSLDPLDMSCTENERRLIRRKYGIPFDKTVLVYGGNLGKPQGIEFMLECLHSQRNNKNVFFLIVGGGTEYEKIDKFIRKNKLTSVKLMQSLPKEDYDRMIGACDVGLIFLDHRFTIPNFPSRMLSYMSAKLPVLAVTDTATDIGKVILEGEFGWWCESNDIKSFDQCLKDLKIEQLKSKGEKAFSYMEKEYSSEKIYQIIKDNISRKVSCSK